jgi:hypothetical protein
MKHLLIQSSNISEPPLIISCFKICKTSRVKKSKNHALNKTSILINKDQKMFKILLHKTYKITFKLIFLNYLT